MMLSQGVPFIKPEDNQNFSRKPTIRPNVNASTNHTIAAETVILTTY
jgi:hypothetical protein